MRVGDAEQRTEVVLGLADHALEPRAPVRHLERRRSDAGKRDQLALRVLEDGQRQCRGSGGEVEETVGHGAPRVS